MDLLSFRFAAVAHAFKDWFGQELRYDFWWHYPLLL